jgi:hypothetical protein
MARSRRARSCASIATGVGGLIHLPKLDEAFALEVIERPRPRRLLHRVEDAGLTEDRHNDYARLLLGLGRTLERLPDDATRRDLLHRMQELLAHSGGAADRLRARLSDELL